MSNLTDSLIERVFTKNAVFNGKFYTHFDIHIVTASMYGNKTEEIVQVDITIATNQSIPKSNEKITQPDYLGFYDFVRQDFTMIYHQRFLLDMCFPAGIITSEEFGNGKSYRLNVVSQQS